MTNANSRMGFARAVLGIGVGSLMWAVAGTQTAAAQSTPNAALPWLPNNGVSQQCDYETGIAIDRAIRLGQDSGEHKCWYRNPSDSSPNLTFDVRLSPGGEKLEVAVNLLVQRDSYDRSRIVRHPAFDTANCADGAKLASFIMLRLIRHQQRPLPEPNIVDCREEQSSVGENRQTASPFGNSLGSGALVPIERRSIIFAIVLDEHRARLPAQLTSD